MSDSAASLLVAARSKNSSFYSPRLDGLSDGARKLLESYSAVEPDRVVEHVEDIRDRAWKIFPYPCIGMFRFLTLSLASSPQYPEIISRLKDNQTFLDLGCCLGTTLRLLAGDGVPAENLYGSDLREEFWELGYALFRDEGRLKASFIAADVFDPESGLTRLDGQVDILHAASLFHLFNYEKQIDLARRIVKLLRPVEGSLLVGRQVGSSTPGEMKSSDGLGTIYRHNVESWAELWRRVGEETGVKFVVISSLEDIPKLFFKEDHVGEAWLEKPQRLKFSVRRVA